MIQRLVVLGATGDLMQRFLLPALAELHEAGRLPDELLIIGGARRELDDDAFRADACSSLDEHAGHVPAAARAAVVRRLRYRQVDVGNARSVAHALAGTGGDGAVAVYLALPQGQFVPAVTALGGASLPPGSRIVVEKPWGDGLAGTVKLNRLLAEVSGPDAEQAVFRVDHVLGLATAHNMLALRLADPVLAPLWNSTHIARVELLWEETLGLEGRAAFYDRTGALRDVIQSHLLQTLCLFALELPRTLGAQDLRDRKAEVLRQVRPTPPEQLASRTRRARYTAGALVADAGEPEQAVPAYAAEAGVDPRRGTETYAEVAIQLDCERWADTDFVLRAGKALQRRRKGILIDFRPLPGGPLLTAGAPASSLWIGLDGPDDVRLELVGATSGPPLRPVPVTLTAPAPAGELSAYARVLLNVLDGDSAFSVRSDEAEHSWRVVTPVLEAWADGQVPLDEYPAGSSGPAPRPGP